MLHPRNHVKAKEALCCGPPHCSHYTLVVVHRTERRDGTITPAMIKNQLSPTGSEALEIRVGCVEDMCEFLVGQLNVSSKVECTVAPCLIVKNHIRKKLLAEYELPTYPRCEACYPKFPPIGSKLSTRHEARENLLSFSVVWASIDLPEGGDLRCC